ncbi:class I SAM-dependent methyltransferase [Seonamhaeicola sediminis]|uniref:Class I SAM-dependent methyltransferase n=1 Tax=Seonamhaeicola sediminis TaxID=2528206 RepID=A0A562YGP8_9FLAO|nr:class I SAM-dependent methyltransferase [Seonamhaeicola sediminis]TWO34053.1 class I SAM-dependent methyltransferase [Seonamhaeicola sediminis]
MTDAWIERWNDRYKKKKYAYGTEPNMFLKEQIQKLKSGTILFGAEGEGRNAVYAAKNGWTVSAFDISEEGKNKAIKLAKTNNVLIDYKVGELPKLSFENKPFDAIALIYAHFPANIKSEYHKLLNTSLKKGGILIFEAFGKNHMKYRKDNPKVGGPPDIDLLFSIEELKSDFENYKILKLEEIEIELNEGIYHNGKGSVIRFIGLKN